MWHATRKLLQYRVPGVWEQEMEAPFLVKWWLFDTFPDRFLYPSLKPLFFFVQNDNVFTVELVAWVFACHMTKPIHNPLRSLVKARRLGRNVTKKLYGESSNWFTTYLYSYYLIKQTRIFCKL